MKKEMQKSFKYSKRKQNESEAESDFNEFSVAYSDLLYEMSDETENSLKSVPGMNISNSNGRFNRKLWSWRECFIASNAENQFAIKNHGAKLDEFTFSLLVRNSQRVENNLLNPMQFFTRKIKCCILYNHQNKSVNIFFFLFFSGTSED